MAATSVLLLKSLSSTVSCEIGVAWHRRVGWEDSREPLDGSTVVQRWEPAWLGTHKALAATWNEKPVPWLQRARVYRS